MPYGLIAMIVSFALTVVYVFTARAGLWSKVLIGGLLLASLVWRYGLFIQVALGIFLSLYFTHFKARSQNT